MNFYKILYTDFTEKVCPQKNYLFLKPRNESIWIHIDQGCSIKVYSEQWFLTSDTDNPDGPCFNRIYESVTNGFSKFKVTPNFH